MNDLWWENNEGRTAVITTEIKQRQLVECEVVQELNRIQIKSDQGPDRPLYSAERFFLILKKFAVSVTIL